MKRRQEKVVSFVGSAREDLQRFPKRARSVAGYQLHRVQNGDAPDDFKPIPSVGAGVYEIRVCLDDHYRVFYVAKFEEAIYVLHAFQKKSTSGIKTPHVEIDKARRRYDQLVQARKGPGRKGSESRKR